MSRCFRPPTLLLGGTAVRHLCRNWLHDWFSFRVFLNYTGCTREMRRCTVGISDQRQDIRATRAVRNTIQTSSTPCDEPQPVDPVFELVDYLFMCERMDIMMSVDHLKSLYTAVKRHGMLRRVTSKRMSSIISLAGALSIPSPRPVCMYIPKHMPQADNAGGNAHWDFILEVARDKERKSIPLNGTDRFWIMRAELAQVPRLPDPLISRSILRAKMQYVRIWRRTSDPEVHVPFLETLVSYSPSDLSDVVKYLCRLLDLYNNPHPRILNVLWIIVLQHSTFLSWDQKASLLSVCSKRFELFAESKILTKAVCGKMGKTMILGALIAGHVFPRFVVQRLKDNLQQWVQGISVAAFDLSIPLETRWSNLVFLAGYFKSHGFHQINGLSSTALTDETVEWRTALILSIVEQEFSKPTSTSRKLADVLHPVWRVWKSSKYDRPLLVSRVVLASFLRLAGIAGEVKLFDDCAHYASLRGLWLTPRNGSDDGAAHMLAAYVTGLVTCHGKKMSHIFQNLDENVSTDTQRAHVIRDLMQHFAIHNVEVAYELYRCCQKRGVFIPAVDVHRMAMYLATSHQIFDAVNFLYTPTFSRGQVELLLGAILRHFQIMRLETIEPHLAAEISGIMETLYNKRQPPIQLKYPIQFFLSMMVSSGYASRAVNVFEVIARISPSFFTARYFARLIRALLHIREFKHVVRVLLISNTMSCRSINIVWNKTMFSLANAGARKLSRDIYQDQILSTAAATTRLSMLRAASFRIRKPTVFATFRVLRVFFRIPSDERTVKDVVTLLVRARRLYAARKIVQVKCSDLKPEMMTMIGNTILGGFLLHWRKGQNGKRVARILLIRTLLEKTCLFIPDRLTTHIIIGALLRWHTVDTTQMKILFDRLVRLGYPSGNRELPQHGVPFGTLPTNTMNLELPVIVSPLSFRKHIKPLYKMFVKAFYQRNDVTAAKTIIAILKDETFKDMQQRQRRERARREGLQRGKRE